MHLLTGKVIRIERSITDRFGNPVIGIAFDTTAKLGSPVSMEQSEHVWFHFPVDTDIREKDTVIISGEITRE